MAIYNRRPSSVEAFQAPFGFNIKHPDGANGYLYVSVGDWVVLDEKNRIEILANQDFQAKYEQSITKPMVHTQRSPSVNSRTITPEDIDMTREF
jgi:hypothetical protein